MKLLNRKGQGEEIGMGIAALGFIILLGLVSFFYFVVLRGNVVRESNAPFAEREYAITTTNYLSNLMATRDDYGIKYSDLISIATSEPDALHPSGKKYPDYFENLVSPQICKWLDANLGAYAYYFFVDTNGDTKYKCGVEPQNENTFSEKQFLPSGNNQKIGAVLVTWPS